MANFRGNFESETLDASKQASWKNLKGGAAMALEKVSSFNQICFNLLIC